MLFGRPQIFAVESEIYQYAPPYLSGHLRFWIGWGNVADTNGAGR